MDTQPTQSLSASWSPAEAPAYYVSMYRIDDDSKQYTCSEGSRCNHSGGNLYNARRHIHKVHGVPEALTWDQDEKCWEPLRPRRKRRRTHTSAAEVDAEVQYAGDDGGFTQPFNATLASDALSPPQPDPNHDGYNFSNFQQDANGLTFDLAPRPAISTEDLLLLHQRLRSLQADLNLIMAMPCMSGLMHPGGQSEQGTAANAPSSSGQLGVSNS